ncbi:MAG TPA: hypothetical protein VK429_06295, partial [Patescibacteria group bacterium]|nr:hypothetical protein [Patescibacteria group bacterium]
MEGRNYWMPRLGIPLAGMMLIGCFVPVAYGVYKIYDTGNHEVLVINVKENPATLYKVTLQTIQDRKITKITKRDDKEMVITGESEKRQVTVKINPLPRDNSQVIISLEKGPDPKRQREIAVS